MGLELTALVSYFSLLSGPFNKEHLTKRELSDSGAVIATEIGFIVFGEFCS